jgi:hypothetical protein
MPLLGALLVWIFDKLFGAWADTLTRKAAIIAAAVATISVATLAFVAAVSVTIASIVPALPGGIALGVWLFVPSNAAVCLGAIFAADSAAALFRWYRANITLAAQVAG